MASDTDASSGRSLAQSRDDTGGTQLSSPRAPRISLKQWRVLQAVVDCGGFAQASEFLHLSQSAISYSLAKLQEQLGIPLLQVEGRKAHLTKMGQAVLERSRRLIKEANEVETFASALERGWEPEIRLAVDFSFPSSLLMRALGKFSQAGLSTSVQLSEVPTFGIDERLQNGSVDIAICTQVPLGFLGAPLMEVEYVAVAASGHHLLSPGKELTKNDLELVTQIVVRDFEIPERRNGAGQWMYHGPCWCVAHFDIAVAAVREGHGFAWLLKYRIQDLLDRHVLATIPLRGGHTRKATLYLIYGGYRASNPGPAVRHLVEILHGVIAEERQH